MGPGRKENAKSDSTTEVKGQFRKKNIDPPKEKKKKNRELTVFFGGRQRAA